MDELIRSEVYDSRPAKLSFGEALDHSGSKANAKPRENSMRTAKIYFEKTCQKQCQERDPDSQQKALLFEIEYPEAQFGAHDGHGPETEPTCILKQ